MWIEVDFDRNSLHELALGVPKLRIKSDTLLRICSRRFVQSGGNKERLGVFSLPFQRFCFKVSSQNTRKRVDPLVAVIALFAFSFWGINHLNLTCSKFLSTYPCHIPYCFNRSAVSCATSLQCWFQTKTDQWSSLQFTNDGAAIFQVYSSNRRRKTETMRLLARHALIVYGCTGGQTILQDEMSSFRASPLRSDSPVVLRDLFIRFFRYVGKPQ